MEKVKLSLRSVVLIVVILIAIGLIITDVLQNLRREQNTDHLNEQLNTNESKLNADSTSNYWKESEFIED